MINNTNILPHHSQAQRLQAYPLAKRIYLQLLKQCMKWGPATVQCRGWLVHLENGQSVSPWGPKGEDVGASSWQLSKAYRFLGREGLMEFYRPDDEDPAVCQVEGFDPYEYGPDVHSPQPPLIFTVRPLRG